MVPEGRSLTNKISGPLRTALQQTHLCHPMHSLRLNQKNVMCAPQGLPKSTGTCGNSVSGNCRTPKPPSPGHSLVTCSQPAAQWSGEAGSSRACLKALGTFRPVQAPRSDQPLGATKTRARSTVVTSGCRGWCWGWDSAGVGVHTRQSPSTHLRVRLPAPLGPSGCGGGQCNAVRRPPSAPQRPEPHCLPRGSYKDPGVQCD